MTEYGIMMYGISGLARGPMTEGQAQDWIESFVEDGGREDVFYIVSREVGEWR